MTTATTSSLAPETNAPSVKPTRTLKQRLVGIAIKTSVAAVVLTGAMGVLHMPFAAPALRMIFPSAVCPVLKGTPAQVDASYKVGQAEMRAAAVRTAPARPALVWQLDKTTESDLAAWASKNGVKCTNINGTATLHRCTEVPPAAVGQPAEFGLLEDVTFVFKSTGELVNVQTTRRRLTPEQASLIASAIDKQDVAVLGEPSKRGGEPTTEALAHGFLATYVAEYNFTDYRASITATNLAPTGVMVREQYLSLN